MLNSYLQGELCSRHSGRRRFRLLHGLIDRSSFLQNILTNPVHFVVPVSRERTWGQISDPTVDQALLALQ